MVSVTGKAGGPTSRISLPIDELLPQIVRCLKEHSTLVLRASPGSGKTTRVPVALCESLFNWQKEVLVLEPRRIAAKLAASRVAHECNEKIGERVGYQFRFENVTSGKTRLRFLTEGMLMRRLISDPTLNGVGAVLLDEFHERHLHTDLALSILKHLRDSKRPDLKIVVMSATLDSDALAQYLGQPQKPAPTLDLAATRFEVELHNLPGPAPQPLDRLVKNAVQQALRHSDCGHILVFLPGMSEIRRAAQALQEFEPSATVLPLHGELSREEQERALQSSSQTKIILSTNIA